MQNKIQADQTGQDELSAALAKVALGDRVAFNLLYERTSAKLFGVCLRILNDRAEAEDVLQSVFVKIWHNADRFAQHKLSEKATPIAWLATIARNQSIDALRKRKPETRQLDEAFTVAAPDATPEDQALNDNTRRQIDLCLEELEVERSKAIKGAYLKGYSYQELADHFGIPVNTMRTWLRRGLASLRKCLEGREI